jgi:hypothetical protein
MEILIAISLFLNIFLLVSVGLLVNSLQTEKKDLLNRLMAKDYNEYALFEERKVIAENTKDKNEILIDQDVFPVN